MRAPTKCAWALGSYSLVGSWQCREPHWHVEHRSDTDRQQPAVIPLPAAPATTRSTAARGRHLCSAVSATTPSWSTPRAIPSRRRERSEGTDTVRTTASSYTLGSNVENLRYRHGCKRSGGYRQQHQQHHHRRAGNDMLNGGGGPTPGRRRWATTPISSTAWEHRDRARQRGHRRGPHGAGQLQHRRRQRREPTTGRPQHRATGNTLDNTIHRRRRQ